MKDRTRARNIVGTGVSVVSLLAVGGCSVPPIEATPPAHAKSAECEQAVKKWPKQVSGLNPYPVTTPSNAVRAWGKRPELAIIARCGVPSPKPTTDACIDVDGVDWVQTPLGKDGYKYVTYGRTPGVEVLVPAKLGGAPATYLPAFKAAAQTIPQSERRCTS